MRGGFSKKDETAPVRSEMGTERDESWGEILEALRASLTSALRSENYSGVGQALSPESYRKSSAAEGPG